MSYCVSLIRDVETAYREATGQPESYILSQADYDCLAAAHKLWVKAGGIWRPLGKEIPNRQVLTITTRDAKGAKVPSCFFYKDRGRRDIPASVLPEVMALLK